VALNNATSANESLTLTWPRAGILHNKTKNASKTNLFALRSDKSNDLLLHGKSSFSSMQDLVEKIMLKNLR
jgi:hypothetical protein